MRLRGPAIRRIRLLAGRGRLSSSGQVLVLFALFLFVIVGFLALAVDGGFILAERRQVQSAADAGALAAAKAIFDNRAGIANASAVTYAQANAGAGATVTVQHPPQAGAFAGNVNYVRVVVQQDVRRYFVGAIYSGSWRATASATAGIQPLAADYALLTLNRSSTPGIYMNGNTGIRITGGQASAMSNTNIQSNGGPSFTTPGTIDANSTISMGGGTWNPPARIRPNRPQVNDPLATMAATKPPKGPARTFAADCPAKLCQPGWYRNQNVTLSGIYTFAPGVYYFENTDIGLQNTNARINGVGVLLYFDSASSFDPKNGDVNLIGSPIPLYTGMQPGLVFWYDSCTTLDIQGNGNVYFSGIFYAPCALTQMHGNPGSDTINGQLIVNRLDVRGTSDMRISYRSWVDTSQSLVFLVE